MLPRASPPADRRADVEGFVDAYAVLGVAPSASTEALKRAHRELVRRHHPDLRPREEQAAATRRVQEINVAYGLVRDPAARARYDRLRTAHLARERAVAPVRQAAEAVREADRSAAAQWESVLAAAGEWAGRWWRRHRFRVADGARRVRRAGTDLVGRVLWLATCVVYLGLGLAAAGAVQRLTPVPGPVVPLAGAMIGLVLGNRRGWRRRLRLAGFPAEAAHRLRGLAELVAAAAALAAVAGLALLLTGT